MLWPSIAVSRAGRGGTRNEHQIAKHVVAVRHVGGGGACGEHQTSRHGIHSTSTRRDVVGRTWRGWHRGRWPRRCRGGHEEDGRVWW
jgi:hypothetical protein